jgi:prepilin-type N-terminal cleavage/methylation domain-containing protein
MTRPFSLVQDRSGFTLIEMMTTLAVFAIVLTAVYSSFVTQFNSWQTQEDVVTVQSDIRAAAEMLTRDIRNSGFGVPTGSGVVTPVAAASGSSITLNIAGATTTSYVTGTNYTNPSPNTYVVPVSSTAGFQVGQSYNTIDIRTQTVELGNNPGDQITAVGPGNFLTLKGTLNQNFVLNVGDIVVTPGYNPVTYSLAAPAFSRTDPVSGSTVVLSNNVQGFSLSYLLTTGATVTNPTNLSQISAVNFTINGQTSNQISKLSGNQRSRTVNAIVEIRNNGNGNYN